MPEAGNQNAAEAATIHDAIDLRALQVLGIMTAHDGPVALLRSSRGQIARIGLGGQAFGVEVIAIGQNSVTVKDRWGKSGALSLPQG